VSTVSHFVINMSIVIIIIINEYQEAGKGTSITVQHKSQQFRQEL